MKTLLKIAAIAAITALAVISCSPPEVPEAHFEWWDEVNEQFDASTYTDNTGYAGFSVYSSLTAYPAGYTGTKSDNTATITFPAKADILKKDTITTADLKNIISFKTYNSSYALTAIPAPGVADTLTDLSGWEFDRRTGNTIYVKLPALLNNSSHIVFILDSTKYTVSNGLKVDKDGNGIAGEAIYDDIYEILTVNTDWLAGFGRSPVLPGNKGWTVTLRAPYSVGYEDTDYSSIYDVVLAYETISGISVTDENTIINSLKGGFKIEQFSDGKWSAYSSTITTTDVTEYTPVSIIAKNFRAAHNTAYRTVFEKGSISLETTQTFFGVKQRIRINGNTGSIYDSAKTNKARVESASSLYYNNDRLAFKDFTSSIDGYGYSNLLYSHDSSGGNVVLKIKLTSPSQSPTTPIISYYFRQLDLTAFKNNFKIYSYNVDWYDDGNDNWYPYPSSIQDANDVTEIGIQKVEFKQEFSSTTTNVSGYNVILITLDPNYVKNNNQKYFYIGNGFVLNDGVTVLVRNHDDYIKGYTYYNVSGF